MAVIPFVRVDTPISTTITWASVTTSDTAEKVNLSDFEFNKTIHIVGSGTAQLRLSNDGTNFVNSGAALAANSINEKGSAAKWWDFSPIASATVTIVLAARKPAPKV
jgi:hypothetical protein